MNFTVISRPTDTAPAMDDNGGFRVISRPTDAPDTQPSEAFAQGPASSQPAATENVPMHSSGSVLDPYINMGYKRLAKQHDLEHGPAAQSGGFDLRKPASGFLPELSGQPEQAPPEWQPTLPMGGDYALAHQQQSLTQGPTNPAPLNMGREAGYLERAGASVKMTPQGETSYYEGLGYKVATDRNGKIFLLDKKTNEWFPADSPNLNLHDIADTAGSAIQLGAEVVGARGGKAIGAATGGGLGNLARQAVSSVLPGEDQMTLGQRAGAVATDTALAGAGQAGVNTALKLADKVRPGNFAARYVDKQYQIPFAKESEAISAKTGQQYTPGQATGSKGLLTIEGLIRRHPLSADKMAEFDAKQLDNSLSNLNQTLDSMSAGSSVEGLGTRVSDAFDSVLNKATKIRRDTAKADFGEVDKLSGAKGVVKPDNLLAEIDRLTEEFRVPGGGDASAALVGRLQSIKQELMKNAGVKTRESGLLDASGKPIISKTETAPKVLTANETQRLLQVYGDALRGTGAIFQDLGTAQQRMIAGKLRDAVMRDVDAAASGTGAEAKVAGALKTARDNYRANSQAIDNLQSSVLGRMFGGTYDKAPERIAGALSNMKPTELRESFAILTKADPGAAQAVKRHLVEGALIKAGLPASANVPAAQVGSAQMFSPAKFLTAIRKSPIWDVADANERGDLTIAVRDLERLSNRAGTDGSPTAPLQFAWETVKAMGGGALSLSPTRMAKTAIAATLPSRAARLITDPAGRKALRTLRSTQPGTKQYTAAAGYATMIMNRNDQEDLRPDASLDAALSSAQE